MLIDVKTAVEKAAGFARQILEPQRTSDMLLEEVEPSEEHGRQVWLVTLSVPRQVSSFAAAVGGQQRDYKRIEVDAETGEVLSMKIRELAGAQ